MKKRNIFVLLIVLLIFTVTTLKAQLIGADLRIVNRFHVNGDGKWDYLIVDDASNRLFLSHGDMVQVLDLKTGNEAGMIPNTHGVHGIAIANEFKKGFISCGKDSAVIIFEPATLKFIAKIYSGGTNPDAIIYDSFSKKVFVFNGKSHNATVIDPKTNKIAGKINLDGKPEEAVSDGKGKIYLNIEDKSMVAVINSMTLKVENQWAVIPGIEPSGIALDIENNRLFTVCNNMVMVVLDVLSGRVITTLPIGARVDGMAYDPEKKFVYSSNGDGTLTVVKEKTPDDFEVIGSITTQAGARTIALDKKTHHLYLPVADYDELKDPSGGTEKQKRIRLNSFFILDIAPMP